MNLSIATVKGRISPSVFYQRELGVFPNRISMGWTDGGLCPFHSDRRKGNFRVNIENGAFKCFSCSARGGDIISYICLRYSKSIPEALEYLAREYR